MTAKQQATWAQILNDGRRRHDTNALYDRAKNWRTCAVGEALQLQSITSNHYAAHNALTEEAPILRDIGLDFARAVENADWGAARMHYQAARDYVDNRRRDLRPMIARHVKAHNRPSWTGTEYDTTIHEQDD